MTTTTTTATPATLEQLRQALSGEKQKTLEYEDDLAKLDKYLAKLKSDLICKYTTHCYHQNSNYDGFIDNQQSKIQQQIDTADLKDTQNNNNNSININESQAISNNQQEQEEALQVGDDEISEEKVDKNNNQQLQMTHEDVKMKEHEDRNDIILGQTVNNANDNGNENKVKLKENTYQQQQKQQLQSTYVNEYEYHEIAKLEHLLAYKEALINEQYAKIAENIQIQQPPQTLSQQQQQQPTTTLTQQSAAVAVGSLPPMSPQPYQNAYSYTHNGKQLYDKLCLVKQQNQLLDYHEKEGGDAGLVKVMNISNVLLSGMMDQLQVRNEVAEIRLKGKENKVERIERRLR